MQWTNPNPIDINYFGICSYQTPALWKIPTNESVDQTISIPSKFPAWVAASNGDVPPEAISIGNSDFIARAKHGQNYIPGRLSANSKTCLYGVLGKEHNSKEYEVLCGGSGSWEPVINGQIPLNAFPCNDANINGTFYIGRGTHDGQLISGKIYPGDGLCLIAYEGEEYILKDYEIYVF